MIKGMSFYSLRWLCEDLKSWGNNVPYFRTFHKGLGCNVHSLTRPHRRNSQFLREAQQLLGFAGLYCVGWQVSRGCLPLLW